MPSRLLIHRSRQTWRKRRCGCTAWDWRSCSGRCRASAASAASSSLPAGAPHYHTNFPDHKLAAYFVCTRRLQLACVRWAWAQPCLSNESHTCVASSAANVALLVTCREHCIALAQLRTCLVYEPTLNVAQSETVDLKAAAEAAAARERCGSKNTISAETMPQPSSRSTALA